MKFVYASVSLVLMAWASGSPVAAQAPTPPSPQPAPSVTAPTPAGAPRPGPAASGLGPIIATSDTQAYVSAEATGHPAVFIGSDVSPYGIMGTFTNHALGFRTNNIARMFIDTGGNVGIGISNPAQKLSVAGTIESMSGGFKFPDGSVQMSAIPTGGNYIQNTMSQQPGANFNIGGDGAIGGRLGLGTSVPSAKLQVSTTVLDQHLYLSSAAPSLALGNSDARSSASMNSIFALATSAGHFGVYAGDLTIANYGDARGDIYIDSNYSGTGTRSVILQPFSGRVGIGTVYLPTGVKLRVDGGSDTGVQGNSTGKIGVAGYSGSDIGVNGYSDSSIGVNGYSGSDAGVYGSSGSTGPGVVGVGNIGPGVIAFSTSGDLLLGRNSAAGTRFRIENNGTAHAPGYQSLPDFAEEILPSPADKSRLEPGDVLVAASDTDRSVTRSRKPYSTAVLGVYSTAPGFIGTEHPIEGASSQTIPMAVIGIVPCKVSAENGPIRRGDLLTTSRTPGHAMRCADRRKCMGAIVGKALATLESGKGVIKVLVTLQ